MSVELKLVWPVILTGDYAAVIFSPDLGSISSRSVGVPLFILLVWDKEPNPDQTLIRYSLSILEYPTIALLVLKTNQFFSLT